MRDGIPYFTVSGVVGDVAWVGLSKLKPPTCWHAAVVDLSRAVLAISDRLPSIDQATPSKCAYAWLCNAEQLPVMSRRAEMLNRTGRIRRAFLSTDVDQAITWARGVGDWLALRRPGR
jgi:hypothetical protein